MRILCADDEPLALDVLRRSLLTVLPDALVEISMTAITTKPTPTQIHDTMPAMLSVE